MRVRARGITSPIVTPASAQLITVSSTTSSKHSGMSCRYLEYASPVKINADLGCTISDATGVRLVSERAVKRNLTLFSSEIMMTRDRYAGPSV